MHRGATVAFESKGKLAIVNPQRRMGCAALMPERQRQKVEVRVLPLATRPTAARHCSIGQAHPDEKHGKKRERSRGTPTSISSRPRLVRNKQKRQHCAGQTAPCFCPV